MADNAKSKPSDGSESSSRTRSETKLQQQQQPPPPPPDLTLGKAPIEKGERTGQSRRFSVPVTQEEREATLKELNEIEPVERIPSILRTMPIRRETSPDRPYALSRESVTPIGYPPEPLN